jgi:hypothetical protein
VPLGPSDSLGVLHAATGAVIVAGSERPQFICPHPGVGVITEEGHFGLLIQKSVVGKDRKLI